MKTSFRSFVAAAFGPALLVSAALASIAPDKPEGGISTLPTPWVFTHRGGGLLWPEETMEAYEASTATGNAFVEVDCHQLSNSAVVLMHDPDLDRTTNQHGAVDDVKPSDWANVMVDGNKLLGPGWGYYHAPYFDEVLARFGNRKIISAEAKDYPCRDSIVYKLREYHIAKDWALVNSTAADRLTPAIHAGYKAYLVLLDMKQTPKSLKNMGLWGVSCPESVTEDYVRELKAVGLKVIGNTTSRQWRRDEMLRWGADGFFTDDPLYMDPVGDYRRNTDPYATQRWAPGMLGNQPGGRGFFTLPNKWGLDTSTGDYFRSCLQGWMCPIGGKQIAPEWTMELSITFGPRLQDGRWASVAILTADVPLNNDAGPSIRAGGYHILFRNTGGISIYRYEREGKASVTLLKNVTGSIIREGETVRYRIATTSEQIKVERLDGKASIEVKDAAYRGAYVTFGARGQKADFSEIRLTVP